MSVIFSLSIPDFLITQAYVVAFILGAIIGSFLNVYIYRFHTGKSLAGHSRCLSCGKRLRWFELIPILSYLAIRGRCRDCKSYVPVRYMLVETLTAFLFFLTLTVTTSFFEILILWFVVSLLVVIMTYDFYHFIIPDSLTITLLTAILVLTTYGALLRPFDWTTFGFEVLFALCGSAFFLLLWVVSKGVWLGFGDVKLVFPLGLLVGGASVFSFIVLSFWVGAGVSICLLAIQRWRRGKSHLRLVSPAITMKSAVPFAPFLISGALLTFFFKINVLSLFSFVL